MVSLRDYARPALSTQHTCCDAFRVVRQRWGQCERLELYKLRDASDMLPLERRLPPHPVANLYERGMRDRIGLACGS
jgi:hypothetical protein